MAKKTIDINIADVFEDTRKGLVDRISKDTGRLEMLDDIAKFFEDKKFKVIQEVEQEAKDNAAK